jgi:hypothetical protein
MVSLEEGLPTLSLVTLGHISNQDNHPLHQNHYQFPALLGAYRRRKAMPKRKDRERETERRMAEEVPPTPKRRNRGYLEPVLAEIKRLKGSTNLMEKKGRR